MDVSIAVSLIRGQMGTVVERAVNGAVETVLAEMLKVVGVKFEELKTQVSSLKKELTTLQREKILREKDSDKTRAMLRYAELKLKYYRQGVEEEMLQQRGHAQGAELPPRISGHGSRNRPPPARLSSSSSLVAVETPGSAPSADHMDTPPPPLTLKEGVARKDEGEESDECVWAELSLQPITMDLLSPASGLQPITMDLPGPAPGPSSAPLPSPDLRPQADSSTMTPQVKQEEFQQEEEEFQQEEFQQEDEEFQQEEEVICIKEEAEEPQEVLATLLPDFHLPGPLPGSEEARSQWIPAPSAGQQRSHMGQRVTFSSAAHSYFMAHQATAPAMGGGGFRGSPAMLAGRSVLAPGPPRPPSRASWTKDLSLYEEYKLRRNELRRRSINRRREIEKALPQPLLADLVRERREKTRLRVARWRAKRKLQQQVVGGAGAQSFAPHLHHLHHQHQQQQQQQLRAAPSSGQQRRISPASPQFNSMTSSNTFPASLSSSAPPPEQQANNQHAVTSSSSNPASHAQLGLSQPGISLTDVQLGLSQAGVSLADSDFFPVL